MWVGEGSTGLFEQQGGTVDVTCLTLGVFDWSSEYHPKGEYKQSGGNATFYYGWIAYGDNTTGNYTMSGNSKLDMTADLYVGYGDNATGVFTQSDGNHTVGGNLYMGTDNGSSGTYNISGGTLDVDGDLYIGEADNDNWTNSGKLDITNNSAVITIADLLHFGINGEFAAVAGSKITMTASAAELENEYVHGSPSKLTGVGNLTIVFEGQDVGGSYKQFEVFCPVIYPPCAPAYFVSGYKLDNLTVGKSGATGPITLKLVDVINNYEDGPHDEALYVDKLTLEAGATFYGNITDGYCIDDDPLYFLNGGSGKRLYMGDLDLDGDVDATDNSTLDGNNPTASGATWSDGDLDGDRDVDDDDQAILDKYYNYGT